MSKWRVVAVAVVIVCLLGVIAFLGRALWAERQEAEQKRLRFESNIAFQLQANFFPDYEQFRTESGIQEVLQQKADDLFDDFYRYFHFVEELPEIDGWKENGEESMPATPSNTRHSPETYALQTMNAYVQLVEARSLGAPEEEIKACFEDLQPYFDILFRWELVETDTMIYAGTPGLTERFQKFQMLIMEDTAGWEEKPPRRGNCWSL